MVLPISQTALALLFGGWGQWLRDSMLDRPFWGDQPLWESTARFHVWPWPLKFAIVLNMPAFIVAGLTGFLPIPFDRISPALGEWVSLLLALPLVVLLWFWVGLSLDRTRTGDESQKSAKRQWIALLLFMAVCAAASSVPHNVGGYVSYFPLGIVIWLIAALGLSIASRYRKA